MTSEEATQAIHIFQAERADRTIMFDLVDYSASVRNTWQTIEKFKTVDDAINEMTASAWEDPDEKLMKTVMIIRNENGYVEAVGMYQGSPISARPIIIWTFPQERSNIRMQYFELEQRRGERQDG